MNDHAPTLFDESVPELVMPDWSLKTEATIQERFEAFHAANPWVFDALETLALDLHGRGRRRIGVKMLAEIVRWNYQRATVGDDFRLNNTYVSRYARLLVERHAELADAIELRELKAA